MLSAKELFSFDGVLDDKIKGRFETHSSMILYYASKRLDAPNQVNLTDLYEAFGYKGNKYSEFKIKWLNPGIKELEKNGVSLFFYELKEGRKVVGIVFSKYKMQRH